MVSKPVVGEINGLPGFRGLTVATNGIIVVILGSNNDIFLGHLDFFVKDNVDEESDIDQLIVKPKQSLKELEEFFV